ncbi:unnamed protein product, partial [Rotaria sp. Silwood1]
MKLSNKATRNEYDTNLDLDDDDDYDIRFGDHGECVQLQMGKK